MVVIRDGTACGTVGNRVACTLMDNAGSTKLHIAEVIFKLHGKQRELIVLVCLHCTLSASPLPSPARSTHTCTQDTLLASSANSTDRPCTVSRISLSFFDRKLENPSGPNCIKTRIFHLTQFHRSFFRSKKSAKTRPK
ncbi:unnamed protein product, partial [Sphacelaria rigidula]